MGKSDQSGSVEKSVYDQTKAWMKKMEETASAANPAANSGEIPGQAEPTQPKKHLETDDRNGGKIPPTDDNKGGDGKGYPSGKEEPFFSKKEIKVILLSCLFLLLLGLLLFTSRTITSWLTESSHPSKAEKVTNLQSTVVVEEVKSTAIAQQAVVAPAKKIVYVSSFNCVEKEERENGYSVAGVQSLLEGQSLHVGPGCALIEINSTVSKLDVSGGYQFAVEAEEKPGNFYKCGTLGGNENTTSQCVDFLNRFANTGKRVRIAVRNGDSHANIN